MKVRQRDIDTHRGKNNVKKEKKRLKDADLEDWRDVGHKPRNSSSHQKLEEARNKHSWSLLATPRFQAHDTDIRLMTSRTIREQISVVLNHHVCGNLLQQP